MHAFKDSGHQDVSHAIDSLIKKGFPCWFHKVVSITSSYHHRVNTKLFISFGSSAKRKT